ncbi:MAG TPA: hypothetical protein VF796_28175 [Humisphaera sp.]
MHDPPVRVRSLLRSGKTFMPVDQYTGRIKDADYVEGAIELELRGVQVLGTDHWDLVDQLWCYLIAGLPAVLRGESFRTLFPDQPLELAVLPAAGDRVIVSVGGRRFDEAAVRRSEFVRQMALGGRAFLEALRRIERVRPLPDFRDEADVLEDVLTQVGDARL